MYIALVEDSTTKILDNKQNLFSYFYDHDTQTLY